MTKSDRVNLIAVELNNHTSFLSGMDETLTRRIHSTSNEHLRTINRSELIIVRETNKVYQKMVGRLNEHLHLILNAEPEEAPKHVDVIPDLDNGFLCDRCGQQYYITIHIETP